MSSPSAERRGNAGGESSRPRDPRLRARSPASSRDQGADRRPRADAAPANADRQPGPENFLG